MPRLHRIRYLLLAAVTGRQGDGRSITATLALPLTWSVVSADLIGPIPKLIVQAGDIRRSDAVGGSLTELPRDSRVNSVQQNVQQPGRTTAGMHDRRQRLRAAEVALSSCVPVVRIEVVMPPGQVLRMANSPQ